MRASHRRVRIEVEQTTVRVQWTDGEMPDDGGHQMAADLLASSEKLRDFDTANSAPPREVNSDPSEGDP